MRDRDLALRVAAVTIAGAAILVLWATGTAPSSGELRDWGDELGWSGPVLWPLVFGVLNFVVPWPILAGATGVVFGTAVGTPVAVAGVLVATTLQLLAARHVAGSDLRRRLQERAPRIDAALERNGFLAIFYSRLAPAVPWGPVNYAAGLARVRVREAVLGTLAGGSPKVFAYVALGGSLDDLSSPEAKVAIGVWIAVAVGGALLARRQFAASP
jgi:uncharacterized membrane protein YdjX (TVP38/TMEM64 family)